MRVPLARGDVPAESSGRRDVVASSFEVALSSGGRYLLFGFSIRDFILKLPEAHVVGWA